MKLLGSMLLVFAVLFAQVGTVAAAPQTQDGTTVTITGTVLEIGQPQTDENGVTTVLVKIETAEGTQTVRVRPEVAATLVVNTSAELTVNSEDVVTDEEPAEDAHPISEMLGDFFDVDPSVVDGYHEDGFGFGVIAQAMWMSQSVTENGDASATECILDAKKNGTYGECFDFGDEPVPTNWGQFKKALKENKDKHNLGVIVSNHADDDDKGKDKGNDKEQKEKKEKKEKKDK